MKKSFFVVPALVLSGVFAVSCSFNGASSDVSFAIDLPARYSADELNKYDYAVYVTGRAEPWIGTISRETNVITLENFPIGSGQTLYAGFLLSVLNDPNISYQDIQNAVTGYSGQSIVNVSGGDASINLPVKAMQANGAFDLNPNAEVVEVSSSGRLSTGQISTPNYSLQICDLPINSLTSGGSLCMCSFTYQTVTEGGGSSGGGLVYGPEIHAECPVWLFNHETLGGNACYVKIDNLTGAIKISNVKLRRWADNDGHLCSHSPTYPYDSGNGTSNDPENPNAILGNAGSGSSFDCVYFKW